MKNKLPLATSVLYLAWSLYHFVCDTVPYYQNSGFDTMSFSLWVNFIFYHSCLALAIYLLVSTLKSSICQKTVTVWLFINATLFCTIENNTNAINLYTSHASPLLSFLGYAVWFLVHLAIITVLFFVFTNDSVKQKLFKISVLFLSASFLASLLTSIFGIQHMLFPLPFIYVVLFALADALTHALYVAAILLSSSKHKIIFWCANIIAVAYSLYLALTNILTDISLFISVPSNAYAQSILEIVKADYIFDRSLLQTICCIIVIVITVCSFKAKKHALTD
ncbi:MAG: hypothetical protein J6I80_02085 [Clostridia bacterium]|nr:hypothetical protein [Clostridia bacterium]